MSMLNVLQSASESWEPTWLKSALIIINFICQKIHYLSNIWWYRYTNELILMIEKNKKYIHTKNTHTDTENRVGRVIKEIKKSRLCGMLVIFRRSILVSPSPQ